MIKAVIFDLDGTLLDREESVNKFIGDQYERLTSTLGHISKTEYISRFIEVEKRGYVWKDKVYQHLTAEFDITEMNWEGLLKDYVSNFKHHCFSFPNLIATLEELKSEGLLLGMITNGYTQFQADNITALGIEPYFDAILISEREGLKKPDARIFQKALEQLGVAAAESIYIGDDRTNDVDASNAAGMTSVWKRNPHWTEVEADFVIDDLNEVPLLLRKLNGRAGVKE